MENIKLEKIKYPKLVTDLASQNHYLKILSYSLIGVSTLLILVIALTFKKGPTVIALESSGSVSKITQELTKSHVEAAAREYLAHRYSWTPENVSLELKKSESFVYPSLIPSFQKSMLEVQKFVKDRKVAQRVYPSSIEVSLKDKTILVVADRFTEFDNLKAATVLKSKLNFDLDSATASNPWGIYVTKETESSEAQ